MQKPLLARSGRSASYSTTRLFVQGSAFFAAGLLQVFWAVSWGHAFGAFIGVMAAATGLGLVCIGACQREAAAAAPAAPAPRLPHQSASSAPAVPRAAVPFINALGTFLAILLLVHAVSPDPRGPIAAAFPIDCTAKPQGCSRIALDRPHRQGPDSPVRLRTPLDAAQEVVEAWVRALPRTDILSAGPSPAGDGSRVVHARVVTFFMGFADDFWMRLSCEGGRTVVEAQGQLRLGVGDLGVNADRNWRLMGAMRAAGGGGKLPKGTCKSG